MVTQTWLRCLDSGLLVNTLVLRRLFGDAEYGHHVSGDDVIGEIADRLVMLRCVLIVMLGGFFQVRRSITPFTAVLTERRWNSSRFLPAELIVGIKQANRGRPGVLL